MTDAQAKRRTLAVLKNKRENVLEFIYDYLWRTLGDGAANYLSATGILSTTKAVSSIKCELRNLLATVDLDPGPLIIGRMNKRRVRLSYKGMFLQDYIRNKGYRGIRRRP